MSDSIIYCPKCLHHYGPLKNIGFALDAVCGRNKCDGTLKAHKPIYAAVFLDADSKRKVLEALPPKHPNVYAEHVTLAFGRHLKEKYPIGREIEFHTGTLYEDDRGQCISISLFKNDELKQLLWEEQAPHVTVSCAEGVKPFYSSDLMKAKTNEKIWIMGLKGVVDYFPRLKA